MSAQADLTELNRRIAVEVMGEPEPTVPPKIETWDWEAMSYGIRRAVDASDNPWGTGWNWEPLDFSEDMDLAMRAVDKVLKEDDSLVSLGLGYTPGIDYSPWAATLLDASSSDNEQVEAYGDSAPEAICRCLLAYVEGGA